MLHRVWLVILTRSIGMLWLLISIQGNCYLSRFLMLQGIPKLTQSRAFPQNIVVLPFSINHQWPCPDNGTALSTSLIKWSPILPSRIQDMIRASFRSTIKHTRVAYQKVGLTNCYKQQLFSQFSQLRVCSLWVKRVLGEWKKSLLMKLWYYDSPWQQVNKR